MYSHSFLWEYLYDAMIEISLNARKELETFFLSQEKQPIRLYLAPGEQSSRLEFILDSPTEGDEVIAVQDFVFCINAELLKKCGGIHIDVTDDTFIAAPAFLFRNEALVPEQAAVRAVLPAKNRDKKV